jgi:hypothetical protein
MARKIYIAIVIIAVLCIASAYAVYSMVQSQQTPPITAVSGLKVGDTFTYSMKGLASLTGPNATVSDSFLDLNQTDYYRVNITSVDGAEVSYNSTWRFLNGTEYFTPGTVNLLSGGGNPDFWAIYPANLTINQFVRPSGTDGAIVNGTEARSYKDSSRQTNYISLQSQFYDSTDPTYTKTYTDYMYVYFDSKTGMLVELKEIQFYSNPEVVLTINWKLEDSNVWAVA